MAFFPLPSVLIGLTEDLSLAVCLTTKSGPENLDADNSRAFDQTCCKEQFTFYNSTTLPPRRPLPHTRRKKRVTSSEAATGGCRPQASAPDFPCRNCYDEDQAARPYKPSCIILAAWLLPPAVKAGGLRPQALPSNRVEPVPNEKITRAC